MLGEDGLVWYLGAENELFETSSSQRSGTPPLPPPTYASQLVGNGLMEEEVGYSSFLVLGIWIELKATGP